MHQSIKHTVIFEYFCIVEVSTQIFIKINDLKTSSFSFKFGVHCGTTHSRKLHFLMEWILHRVFRTACLLIAVCTSSSKLLKPYTTALFCVCWQNHANCESITKLDFVSRHWDTSFCALFFKPDDR